MKKSFKINVELLTIAAFVTFISMMFIQEFSIFISKPIFLTKTFNDIAISNFVITTFSSLSKQNECIIFNKITIYDITKKMKQQFIAIIEAYILLWQNIERIVNVFKENWMFITFKSNTKIDVAKIYSLNFADREFVDKKFNKFHDQKWMKFIKQFTSFDWSIFIIWRIIEQSKKSLKKKSCVMIDIRDFNKIMMIDFYFLFLQLNIIVLMIDCCYIIVVDVAEFFHQWLIKIFDREKFIVVLHRDQEQFNVIVIKFKNSSLYVQRQIDESLRFHRNFVRAYVNDIIIFSKIFEKYLNHLHIIFELLDFKDITFSSKKSFFNYFTVIFLNQKMNAFDLIATKNKIDVIFRLNFFYKLSNLKLYLKLTKWFRDYILWYA